MGFSIEMLLRPVDEARPMGPSLRDQDEYDTLKALTAVPEEVNWTRVHETALALAERLRDLRVWVWLARAALVTDGLRGLADGLHLIAAGLTQYWATLPPVDDTASEPRGRFLARITALGTLGMTSYLADRRKIMAGGTTIIRLAADLETATGRLERDPALRSAIAACRTALAAIETSFRDAYGERADPQIGFELILDGLAAAEARFPAPAAPQAAGGNGHDTAAAREPPAAVGSREDVERVLDMVLAFYRTHELASPVPLLIGRARRLVRMSFVDALRDLAPTGMKELQVVAGLAEDGRQ
jgi:type VI secretion system protein ImpA